MLGTQPKDELGRFASPNDEPLSKKVIGVRFPLRADETIRALAKVRGKPPSELVREATMQTLERKFSSVATVDNPLVREAIANSIALKREALAAEKKRLSKADQSLIERWSFEIKQLEELL